MVYAKHIISFIACPLKSSVPILIGRNCINPPEIQNKTVH